MKLRSMEEVEQVLRPYYEVARRTTGSDITVERIERFMDYIGHPERELKVVHIAGTSGKTSTTSYVAALLHATGQKVGHTISPHVSLLAERVQINGEPLEGRRFCGLMGEFLDLAAIAPETPSWFELMIAFALWTFAHEKVDYAVLETGMGGLHDATNVCNRSDKVCVITDIGLDHTRWLGDTVQQIAAQKAGIIHPGNTVFMYEQEPDIMQVVKFKVNQTKNAEFYLQHQDMLAQIYGHDFADSFPLYQQRNWLLAYAVCRYLIRRDGLPLLSGALRVTQHSVHGRMEYFKVKNKTVILDGAHNTPKMRAFVDSFKKKYGKQKIPILIALKNDKEEAEIGPIIAEIASEVITTAFHGSQDWPTAAHDPDYLAAVMKEYVPMVRVAPTAKRGLTQLLAAASDIVIVTGSLYLVSEVRSELLRLHHASLK